MSSMFGPEDKEDGDEWYKRNREIMNGPKSNKQLNQNDMDKIDFSVPSDAAAGGVDIEKKKLEYLGGDDDDLRDRGFMDDEDEIDFSNFKVGAKSGADDEEEAVQSLFGKLTSAFKNYTGNKVMTKADMEPILQEFRDNLTNKNVSAEIAAGIC